MHQSHGCYSSLQASCRRSVNKFLEHSSHTLYTLLNAPGCLYLPWECLYQGCSRCANVYAKLLDAGVEHLLRDVKDSTVSNLSSEVSHMASGLRALKSRLSEVQEYLNLVLEGRLPVNHDIMYHLQVSSCSITAMPAPLKLQVQGGHFCWLLTCNLEAPGCMIVVNCLTQFNNIGSLSRLRFVL